jgi:hypothetical protein
MADVWRTRKAGTPCCIGILTKKAFITEGTEFGMREVKKSDLREWVAMVVLKEFLCVLCVETLLRPRG